MSKEKYLVNNMSSSGYLKGGQNDSKEVIQSTLREFRALFDVLLYQASILFLSKYTDGRKFFNIVCLNL